MVLIYLDTDAGMPTVPLGLYEINMFFYGQKMFFLQEVLQAACFPPSPPFLH